MKNIIILLFVFLAFSCVEENSESSIDEDGLSNEIKFSVTEFNIDTNLDTSKYLIKSSNEPSSSNSQNVNTSSALAAPLSSYLSANISVNSTDDSLSYDSVEGYVYALNSEDQVIGLFEPYDSGELLDISKKGNTTILVGEFTKNSFLVNLPIAQGTIAPCTVFPIAVSAVGSFFTRRLEFRILNVEGLDKLVVVVYVGKVIELL